MLNQLDATQTRQLVDACPVGLLLLDASGVARWMNDTLRALLGDRVSQIMDRCAADVEESYQGFFSLNSTVHLPVDHEHDELWLMGNSQALSEGGTAQYFTDVTPFKRLMQERDQLRESVDELTVTDDTTGMPNRRALYQSLAAEVSRSRRYQNPLSILLIRIENQDEYLQKSQSDDVVPLLLAIRNALNEQLRWADLIGRLDEQEFLLILPETKLADTQKVWGLLEERLKKLDIEGMEEKGFTLEVNFAAEEWQKGDDVGLLMMRAHEKLKQEDYLEPA